MNTSTPGSEGHSHWNLPNTLTWMRILMIPAILVLFNLPYWWKDPAACAAFALAGITDSLDGYYARKWGQTSRLGAFLDPVGAKRMLASTAAEVMNKNPPAYISDPQEVIVRAKALSLELGT